jgi:hypothetical protein
MTRCVRDRRLAEWAGQQLRSIPACQWHCGCACRRGKCCARSMRAPAARIARSPVSHRRCPPRTDYSRSASRYLEAFRLNANSLARPSAGARHPRQCEQAYPDLRPRRFCVAEASNWQAPAFHARGLGEPHKQAVRPSCSGRPRFAHEPASPTTRSDCFGFRQEAAGLHVPQVRIMPIASQQVGMTAVLDDSAFIEDQDAVQV